MLNALAAILHLGQVSFTDASGGSRKGKGSSETFGRAGKGRSRGGESAAGAVEMIEHESDEEVKDDGEPAFVVAPPPNVANSALELEAVAPLHAAANLLGVAPSSLSQAATHRVRPSLQPVTLVLSSMWHVCVLDKYLWYPYQPLVLVVFLKQAHGIVRKLMSTHTCTHTHTHTPAHIRPISIYISAPLCRAPPVTGGGR